jgi:hypothetical protein
MKYLTREDGGKVKFKKLRTKTRKALKNEGTNKFTDEQLRKFINTGLIEILRKSAKMSE